MQRASPDQHLNPWTFRGDFGKSTRAIRSNMAAARKPFLEIRVGNGEEFFGGNKM